MNGNTQAGVEMAGSGALKTGSRWLPLALLGGSGACLGLSTILAKTAFGEGLSAFPFLTWSLLTASVSLLVRNMIRQRRRRVDTGTLTYFLVAALLSVAAPNLILFTAVPYVGAGFASLTVAFPPLLTYVVALALRMERFAALRASGVLVALAGAALLATNKLDAPDAATAWVFAALCTPFFLAAGNIYRTARWPAGAQPDDLAPGMLVAAAFMLFVFGLITGTSLAAPLDRVEPIMLIAVQGAAFSLQYVLFFRLQKISGPVVLSLLGSVAAVVGVPMSVLWLGESWPDAIVPAALLIATGIAFISVKQAQAPAIPS